MHGIDSSIPRRVVSVKEKYGIGLNKRELRHVIDPLSLKKLQKTIK